MKKENLINNIVVTLIDFLGKDIAEKVKDIITLEMRNIKIEEEETALITHSD